MLRPPLHIIAPVVSVLCLNFVPNVHAEALMPLFEAIDREATAHSPRHRAAGMSLLVELFAQSEED